MIALLSRFTTQTTGLHHGGRMIAIPGLFQRYDSVDRKCGSIVLFRGKKNWGWSIHTWQRVNRDWATTRCWWFGLFSVIQIDAGPNNNLKHCTAPGWHVRFAKIEAKRIYGGFSLAFKSADKGYSA